MRVNHKKLNADWLNCIPIAHRGLHTNNSVTPENSLKAFDAAVEKGYAIEIDIHLLADNNIAVFHDENLMRMCNIDRSIQSLNKSDINRINLLNSNEKIPLLEEVFQHVNGKVPILIEIKKQKNNHLIQEVLIAKLSSYKGYVAIQSFSPLLMTVIRKKAPQIPRGQLSYSYSDVKLNWVLRYLLKNFYLNFISKPHFIAYSVNDLPNNRIIDLKNKGLIVLYWTINNENIEVVDNLYDNIIFEGLNEFQIKQLLK